jgi:hypothetical protein
LSFTGKISVCKGRYITEGKNVAFFGKNIIIQSKTVTDTHIMELVVIYNVNSLAVIQVATCQKYSACGSLVHAVKPNQY